MTDLRLLRITDVQTGLVMILIVQADDAQLESIIQAYRAAPGLKLAEPVRRVA